jgi:hypothetical protein
LDTEKEKARQNEIPEHGEKPLKTEKMRLNVAAKYNPIFIAASIAKFRVGSISEIVDSLGHKQSSPMF